MPLLALSFAQKIIGTVMLSVILALSIALFFSDRRADKWEGQSRKLAAQLELISNRKDEQKKATAKNIETVKERIKYVDRVAGEIEGAPLPGQCATPPQVMSADI